MLSYCDDRQASKIARCLMALIGAILGQNLPARLPNENTVYS